MIHRKKLTSKIAILIIFGILLIILFSSLVISRFIKKKTAINNKANALVPMTNNLLNPKLPVEVKRTIALQRKNKLLEYLENDQPDEVVKNAFSAKELLGVNQSLKDEGLMEKHIQVSGILDILHADDFINKRSSEYIILTNTNKTESPNSYVLYYPSSLEKPDIQYLQEKNVEIEAIVLDNKAVVIKSKLLENSVLNNRQVSNYSTDLYSKIKTIKYAVFLVNFTDDTSEPFSKDEINNNLFSSSNQTSIHDFFWETSYHQFSFEGNKDSIYGWITLNRDHIPESMFNYTLIFPAIAANQAKKLGYQPKNYDGRIFIYNFDNNYPGFARPIYNDIYLFNNTENYILAHEIGHRLGLHHANYLTCKKYQITDQLECFEQKGGDAFDAMGLYLETLPAYSANSSQYLGWLPEDQLAYIDREDSTITLSPVETDILPGQKRLLKIPIDYINMFYPHYLVEFRKPKPYYQYPSLPNSFILIRKIPDITSPYTALIDVHPSWDKINPISSVAYAYLQQGEYFYDPTYKIKINVDKIDNYTGKATISVMYNIKQLDCSNYSNNKNVCINQNGACKWTDDLCKVCINSFNPIGNLCSSYCLQYQDNPDGCKQADLGLSCDWNSDCKICLDKEEAEPHCPHP